MKTPPTPERHVIQSILHWVVDGSYADEVVRKNMKEFYRSLKSYGIKHNSKEIFFRGLRITEKGLMEFFKKGSLKLKNRNAESWTCDEYIAENFAKGRDYDDFSGIILAKQIPENKVVINFQQIREAYGKFKVIEDAYWEEALFAIDEYDECELVTDTICTKCSVKEVAVVEFVYNNYMGDEFVGFLELHANLIADDFKKIITTGKSYFGVRLTNDGHSWEIQTY